MTTAHASHTDHAHPAHLAHHFDNPVQQYTTAKLGMWVFLATEILMFGGLFCAYGVYRGTHPEVFAFAHHYLNTTWGAINTVVLLSSSLTMAWGVRAAQMGKRNLLLAMLALTILGGCGFMCIKYIEYSAKWEHISHGEMFSLFVGKRNAFRIVDGAPAHPEQLDAAIAYQSSHGEAAEGEQPHGAAHDEHAVEHHEEAQPTAPDDAEAHTDADPAEQDPPPAVTPVVERSAIAPPQVAPAGVSAAYSALPPGTGLHYHRDDRRVTWDDLPPRQQDLVNQFFSIYFLMTGLHGIHVLVGIIAIGVLFAISCRGVFGPHWYTPVDLVGLYWHLVDLIWIFLFPLLYLIR